jgi:hypothetical protein
MRSCKNTNVAKHLLKYIFSGAGLRAWPPRHFSAAADLYGSTSLEVRAVMSSFAAINVGAAAPDPRVIVGIITQILLD